MDNNIFIFIVAGAVGGIMAGGLIGYLVGIRKSAEADTRATRFETMSKGFHDQIAGKDSEIGRLNEQDVRKQTQLLAAESAKTKAETELVEANESLTTLAQEIESYKAEIASFSNANTQLKTTNAELNANYNASLKAVEEHKQFILEADVKLRDAFKSLSSAALDSNNSAFLHLAKQSLEAKVTESSAELEQRKQAIDLLVKPLSESLKNFDGKLGEIEIKREGAYSEMKTLVEAMKDTHQRLEKETRTLGSALKTSHTRGRYGEISLRRLMESAGLEKYCHYTDQPSVTTEDGRLRPDCAVNLPGQHQLILDSKVPLNSYLQVFETEDEGEKLNHLKRHAAAVRDHFVKLSNKSYWQQFADAPDFVIMYMHIESSYGAALMTDTALIEDAFDKKVIFATPSTLLAILRTAGYMWQQEKMAERVLEMQNAGIELYKRTTKMLEHFTKVGSGLTSAVNSYNNAVGSMESRVITQLAKIKEIGGSSTNDELPSMRPVEIAIRPLIKSIGPIGSVEGDDETMPILE